MILAPCRMRKHWRGLYPLSPHVHSSATAKS